MLASLSGLVPLAVSQLVGSGIVPRTSAVDFLPASRSNPLVLVDTPALGTGIRRAFPQPCSASFETDPQPHRLLAPLGSSCPLWPPRPPPPPPPPPPFPPTPPSY